MAVCVSASVLLAACEDGPLAPSAPTPATPSSVTSSFLDAPFPPPAPPGTSRALAGTVRSDGGVPAPDASVVVLAVGWYGAYTIEASATTDGEGTYSMPRVRAYEGPDGIGWLLVGASKPGYFSDFKWWLDFPKDADLDLQLDRLTFIRVGETVRGQIGDSMCAGLGYGGWYGQRAVCQRYAITAPASGTLHLTVSAAMTNFDVDVLTADGTFLAEVNYPHPSGVPAVSVPVNGGSIYQIRLAGASSQFELTTRLR